MQLIGCRIESSAGVGAQGRANGRAGSESQNRNRNCRNRERRSGAVWAKPIGKSGGAMLLGILISLVVIDIFWWLRR